MREEVLVDTLQEYLSGQGYETIREVRFLHRIVDLVAISTSSQSIMMIEAKITKWKKALDQARSCLLGADEVYIAMPAMYAHRVDQDILKEQEIGLIAVGESIEIRLKPQRSWGKIERHADQVRFTVRSRLLGSADDDNPSRGARCTDT